MSGFPDSNELYFLPLGGTGEIGIAGIARQGLAEGTLGALQTVLGADLDKDLAAVQ